MIKEEEKIELPKEQAICLKCMNCCKQIHILTAYRFNDDGIKQFYSARGFKLYSAKIGEDDNRLLLVTQLPCPFLTPLGCAIYANRPQVCKDYDGRTDHLVDCKWRELDKQDELDKSRSESDPLKGK